MGVDDEARHVTHHLVLMKASAWPVKSQVVASDEIREVGQRLLLLLDGRPVFEAPLSEVAAVEGYVGLASARRALATRLEARGQGSLTVSEIETRHVGSTRNDTRARGGPAEGISVRIDEG